MLKPISLLESGITRTANSTQCRSSIGAGVSATSIGPPDLSGTFEFNLQAATGVRWFIRDDVALGIEARYLHMSCAGIHPPNLGLNNVGGMVGITLFF